jgi:hypothetical protein
MSTDLDMGTLNTSSVRGNKPLSLRVCEYILSFLRQVFSALSSQASIFWSSYLGLSVNLDSGACTVNG